MGAIRFFYSLTLIFILLYSSCVNYSNFREENINGEISFYCPQSLTRLSDKEKEEYYKPYLSKKELPNTIFLDKNDSVLFIVNYYLDYPSIKDFESFTDKKVKNYKANNATRKFSNYKEIKIEGYHGLILEMEIVEKDISIYDCVLWVHNKGKVTEFIYNSFSKKKINKEQVRKTMNSIRIRD